MISKFKSYYHLVIRYVIKIVEEIIQWIVFALIRADLPDLICLYLNLYLLPQANNCVWETCGSFNANLFVIYVIGDILLIMFNHSLVSIFQKINY